MATILLVDDEPAILKELSSFLAGQGHEVVTCQTTAEAWKMLRKKSPDVVILDVWFSEGPQGIDLLEQMKADDRMTATIMMSGSATVELAVKAIKSGAFDFVEKPFSPEKLSVNVSRALRMAQLERENISLKEDLKSQQQMIGASEPMRKLREQIKKIADSKARVLILGENGTGKELVARAIHEQSPRRKNPFVKVNCAAIPKELVESEVFGHEKGAFTGATTPKKGRFELADSGTLFMDEIGDMDLSTQAKLLRFLETGEIERVGAASTITVDVRLLAATNKNLEEEINRKAFREDLYFRLSVLPVVVPPLRDRLEDIPELAHHFLSLYCAENCKPTKSIDQDVIEYFSNHSWPGNVRELRNLMERLVIMVDSPVIRLSHVRSLFEPAGDNTTHTKGLKGSVNHAEREVILKELEACGWRISTAAERLGIDRTNLYRKMKKYGIAKPER